MYISFFLDLGKNYMLGELDVIVNASMAPVGCLSIYGGRLCWIGLWLEVNV